MSWLFAVIAERFWFCLESLVGLKIVVFLLGDLSRVWVSWLARWAKYGVDIVSHSILVLFTRRKRSQFSPLVNTELRAMQIESISEGRPDFLLKITLSIVILMNRLIRFLFECLNFVSVHRLWKSPRNCLMKLPSDCLSLLITEISGLVSQL